MKLRTRIRYFWHRARMERELTEELEHHLQLSGDDRFDMHRALHESGAVWRWHWWTHLRRLKHAPQWFARRFFQPRNVRTSIVEWIELGAFYGLIAGWKWLTGAELNTRTALALASFYILLSIMQGLRAGEITFKTYREVARRLRPKRVFVEDPDAVLELAKLTGYESIQPFNRYRGKWMTLSAEFEGFTEAFERDALHVSMRLEDGRRLILRFNRDQRESLERLQPGQRITAIGEIEQVRFELRPQNCELVRVEPLRAAPRLTLAS